MPRYDFDRVASKTLADEGGANVSDDIPPSERKELFAEPIAEQECLVDCDGRLRAFAYSYRDKKDVSRHVAGNINGGNATFLRIGVNLKPLTCSVIGVSGGTGIRQTLTKAARSNARAALLFGCRASLPAKLAAFTFKTTGSWIQ